MDILFIVYAWFVFYSCNCKLILSDLWHSAIKSFQLTTALYTYISKISQRGVYSVLHHNMYTVKEHISKNHYVPSQSKVTGTLAGGSKTKQLFDHMGGPIV